MAALYAWLPFRREPEGGFSRRIRVVPRNDFRPGHESVVPGAFCWLGQLLGKGKPCVERSDPCMNQGYRKYKPFVPIGLQNRTWPDQVLLSLIHISEPTRP